MARLPCPVPGPQEVPGCCQYVLRCDRGGAVARVLDDSDAPLPANWKLPSRKGLTPEKLGDCNVPVPGPDLSGASVCFTRCRVTAGDCSPAVPTDPDVPNSGIQLPGLSIRYAM